FREENITAARAAADRQVALADAPALKLFCDKVSHLALFAWRESLFGTLGFVDHMTAENKDLFEARLGFFQSADLLFEDTSTLLENSLYRGNGIRAEAQTLKEVDLIEHRVHIEVRRCGCVHRIPVERARFVGVPDDQLEFAESGRRPNTILT